MTGVAVASEIGVGTLPEGWSPDLISGVFAGMGARTGQPIRVRARVLRPLRGDTQYVLDRFGARRTGPLGRPRMHPLPEELADGVSLLSFEEGATGALIARVDLIRRAWNLDIVVSARAVQVEDVDDLYDDMLALLGAIGPQESTS